MKTASQVLADQLAATLSEACCDSCGTMSKKTGKKVCCGGHGKPKTEAKAGKVHYAVVADLKKAAETGESLDDLMKKRYQTEENHFLYIFPDDKKAKEFAEEAGKKYGWKIQTEGHVAGMITKAFADEVAAKFGGKDVMRETIYSPEAKALEITPFLKRCFDAVTDPTPPATKTEAAEKHTHPFIKRCVAARAQKAGANPAALSRSFAICTAAKKAHPGAAKEKAKEGVPEKRMGQYEKALATARAARK